MDYETVPADRAYAVKAEAQPRVCGTDEAFKFTEEQADRLIHVIDQLEGRLASVLRAEMGTDVLSAAREAPPSPMAERIHNIGRRLDSFGDRLSGVLDRLDV